MFGGELNHYWRTVVETIQDGVMIVNTEGRIVTVNSAFEIITGYSRDEAVGQLCSILGCSACKLMREGNSCHWCIMLERGKLKKQKCTLQHKGGTLVNVVKNASVLEDSGGKDCTVINFDPTVLSAGFSASADPFLRMRSTAYAISFGKRMSGQ